MLLIYDNRKEVSLIIHQSVSMVVSKFSSTRTVIYLSTRSTFQQGQAVSTFTSYTLHCWVNFACIWFHLHFLVWTQCSSWLISPLFIDLKKKQLFIKENSNLDHKNNTLIPSCLNGIRFQSKKITFHPLRVIIIVPQVSYHFQTNPNWKYHSWLVESIILPLYTPALSLFLLAKSHLCCLNQH